MNATAVEVVLVDGTYELFRAHFGAPAATSPDGREVGATRGLLRSLIALLTERPPGRAYVAVAFDHEIESFRNELFEGYKTGEGIDEALRAQFSLAEEGCAALGLHVWPMTEMEADDALATAAASLTADARIDRIVIASPDKDLAQCVQGERVVLLDRRKNQITDEPGVIERFGVPPSSIADYLALVGDSADGIPGIPRWGAKSAAAVLGHYLRLEAIPEDAGAWVPKVRGAATLATNLNQARAEAMLYRKLAELRLDAPIDASLESLRWTGPASTLGAFADSIGDRRLVARVDSLR